MSLEVTLAIPINLPTCLLFVGSTYHTHNSLPHLGAGVCGESMPRYGIIPVGVGPQIDALLYRNSRIAENLHMSSKDEHMRVTENRRV